MLGPWEVLILLGVIIAFSIPFLIALVGIIRSKLDKKD